MNNDQFTYVEVVRKSDHAITHRIYIKGGDRSAQRVEDGLNINLNHEVFYTQTTTYESAQELNPEKATA